MSWNHRRLHAARWAATRRTVLERDGWRCVQCGRYGHHCDHVTALQREPGQDPYDPNGCQTLCRECHAIKTAGENRRPRTAAEQAWDRLVLDMVSG